MDQPIYFRSHPPRCIAGFVARNTELPGVAFDGHASLSDLKSQVLNSMTVEAPEHINPVFALSCSCGTIEHYVHGYRWRNPDYHNQLVFLSPLALECASCGKTTDLLDTDIHGYDGELGHGTATVRAEGHRVVFECPTCGRQPLGAFVRFEFPDDLFDGDFKEYAGRQQDLFTWFSLVGKCSRCSRLLPIADFECA
jgi:hypothetical protein